MTAQMTTTDLTLASYLACQGLAYEHSQDGTEVKPGQPQGAWVFKDTQHLADLVDEFNDGDALVEPKEFSTTVKRMRREMFQYLGIGN